MDLPAYSEFVPNLEEAEDALEDILDEAGETHRNFSYHLEEAAVSAFWEESKVINEIAVYHLSNPGHVKIEGYSRKGDRFADNHFGQTHVSTLRPSLEAQYGMLSGLEDQDYVFRPDLV